MTICTIAGGVGTGYTLGDNRVGMNLRRFATQAHHLVGQQHAHHEPSPWRRSPQRQHGAHWSSSIPSDPTADAADVHLAPVWTDAALALGLLNVVLAEAKTGTSSTGTQGWDAFRSRIPQYPPDRVAEICARSRHRRSGKAGGPHPTHRDQ
jgi:anaerobic selenocysteine-containing dehydrogenase